MSMGCSKKLLQDHLHKTTGKNVILRDLHNIAAFAKNRDSLEVVMEKLDKVEGLTVKCLIKNEEVIGFFY